MPIKPIIIYSVFFLFTMPFVSLGQQNKSANEIDKKVSAFLEKSHGTWNDMNVPEQDGKVLYDIIVKHNYKKALEIGTSTGHSGIWIAWALSKTGGKLITIEIDETRHKEALANFKEAGLDSYIDARLGDAHKIVPELKGPFDFVFSDADKEWYKQYLVDVLPKLEKGGCFTAHNVLNNISGIREFMDYLKSLPELETEVVRGGGSGISVSYKK